MTDEIPDEVTVSMRVEDIPNPLVSDSKTRPCEGCGKDVWISPATQYEIDRGVYPPVIYCVGCVTDNE